MPPNKPGVAPSDAGEERLKTILRAARLGDWELDPRTLAGRCSDLHYEIFGYQEARPKWSLQRFLGHVVEADRERVTETIRKGLVEKSGWSLDCRIVGADQSARWISVHASFFRAAGKRARVVGVAEDISARKASEEADRRLCDIVRGMSEACFALDLEWRFTFVNEQCQNLCRHSPEQMLGRSIWEVFHKLVGTWMEGCYRRAMTQREAVSFETFSPIAERWLDIRLFPTPEGLAAFLLDIQDRKLAEEQLKSLNLDLERQVQERIGQLEAANKELEAFSYSISHDLRSPLRALDGFSQILSQNYASQIPPEGQHYLSSIRKAAQRMGQLTDDLLEFARVNRHQMRKRAVDTRRLVESILAELTRQFENSPEVEWGPLPPCWGDQSLLALVWTNLLSNALKYSHKRERPRLKLGSRAEGLDTVYFVSDNGAGFDMAYADKLFRVFQRLHPVQEFEGTGVGLAIVERVVQRHGGSIWAEAAVDQGATFFFKLGAS